MSTEAALASVKPLTLLDLDLKLSAPVSSLPLSKTNCPRCDKRRSAFCPECQCLTLPPEVKLREPVALPLKVHIWRSRTEDSAKSTSTHVPALMGSHQARIVELEDPPLDDYEADPEGVLLLFPSAASVSCAALPDPIERYHTLVCIDCSWSQSGSATIAISKMISAGKAVSRFKHVHLQAYSTLFWRYQQVGEHCLSTLEAIYFFEREFFVEKARRQARARALTGTEAAAASASSEAGDVGSSDESAGAGSGAGSNGSSDAAAASAASAGSTSATADASAAAAPDSATDWVDARNALYDGRFDDMVLLFLANYQRVQREYTSGARAGEAYNPKMRAGYIKGAATSAGAGAGSTTSGGSAGASAASAGGGSATLGAGSVPGGVVAAGEGSSEAVSLPHKRSHSAAFEGAAADGSSSSSSSGAAGGAGAAADSASADAAAAAAKRARPARVKGAWALNGAVLSQKALAFQERGRQTGVVQSVLANVVGAAAAASAGAAAAGSAAPEASPQAAGGDGAVETAVKSAGGADASAAVVP